MSLKRCPWQLRSPKWFLVQCSYSEGTLWPPSSNGLAPWAACAHLTNTNNRYTKIFTTSWIHFLTSSRILYMYSVCKTRSSHTCNEITRIVKLPSPKISDCKFVDTGMGNDSTNGWFSYALLLDQSHIILGFSVYCIPPPSARPARCVGGKTDLELTCIICGWIKSNQSEFNLISQLW